VVIALVSDVLSEFGLEFGVGTTTDDALRELPASYEGGGGAFWVATRGGEVLGTCGVYPVAPGSVELRKMYLRPAARGLRLGERLLDPRRRPAARRALHAWLQPAPVTPGALTRGVGANRHRPWFPVAIVLERPRP
jgi:GNAT superfamily N-acetyltransferase